MARITGRSKKRNKPIPIAVVLLIGLLFVAVGAGYIYFSYKFTQTAIVTTGTVTHVKVSHSSGSSGGSSSTTYYPTFAFLDEQGTPQSAQPELGSSGYNFPIGTEKSIRYDPNNPGIIKLDNWFDLWGFGILFSCVGFGIFAYVAFSAQQKKKPGYLRRGADASAEDVDRMAALLRKMGRHEEADEIIRKMKSAENDARPRD